MRSASVKKLRFVIGESLKTPTGGYVYDNAIVTQFRASDWAIDVHTLGAGFPYPSNAQRECAEALFQRLPANMPCVVDGLVFSALPEQMATAAKKHKLIALIHHPLARETGLTATEVDRFWRGELAALNCAHAIIATSAATRHDLISRGVPPSKIQVVKPGVHRDDALGCEHHSSNSLPELPSRLLTVGSVIPRKGYPFLIDAMQSLADLPWDLTCVGSLVRAPAHVREIQRHIERTHLEKRVALVGEVNRASLIRHYRAAHLFVFPSLYEGYGIVLGEALAHGLPVISTRAGATEEAVPANSVEFVASHSAVELAQRLRDVLTNADFYASLRKRALAAQSKLRSWEVAGIEFSGAIANISS